MESLKITHLEMDTDPDSGELYVLINTEEPQPAVSWLVDDERDLYLRTDPTTGDIVGASALFANAWFDEIAEAFRRHDLNHPDVRFFLEKKINELAERLPAEIEHAAEKVNVTDSTELAHSKP